MEIIELMNNCGATAIITGVLACIICGIIKLPIAKKIRLSGQSGSLSDKAVSDKIRNLCNLIVVGVSALILAVWYGVFENAEFLLTSGFYTDIMIAFTAAKLLYMLYEGTDPISVKKLLHNLIAAAGNKNKIITAAMVDDFMMNELSLPLTSEQIDALNAVLEKNTLAHK